jgi:hypothetical protein
MLVPGETELGQCPYSFDTLGGRGLNPLVICRLRVSVANNSYCQLLFPRSLKHARNCSMSMPARSLTTVERRAVGRRASLLQNRVNHIVDMCVQPDVRASKVYTIALSGELRTMDVKPFLTK